MAERQTTRLATAVTLFSLADVTDSSTTSTLTCLRNQDAALESSAPSRRAASHRSPAMLTFGDWIRRAYLAYAATIARPLRHRLLSAGRLCRRPTSTAQVDAGTDAAARAAEASDGPTVLLFKETATTEKVDRSWRWTT